MKRLILISLLITPLFAMSADPAFNAGASFGKENAGAGTGSLKNPGAVTGSIPGYTANPPEKGYYGGVQGGDGGLANKGQAALQGSNAGQAVISSGNTNPIPTIDPNAPFITIGKNAEAGADGVLAGTAKQCTEATVSKTTFENFQCDRDAYVVQSCTRTGTMTGHWETTTTTSTVTIDSVDLELQYPNLLINHDTAGGRVKQATLNYSFDTRYGFDNAARYMNVTVLGNTMNMYESSGTYTFTPLQTLVEGEDLIFTLAKKKGTGAEYNNWLLNSQAGHLVYHFVLTMTFETETKKWVPEVTWSESCSFNKAQSAGKTDSQCSIEGGARTQVVDGKSYSVSSDCWQYTDYYAVKSGSEGNCGALIKNAACTQVSTTCTQKTGAFCEHESVTFQCQKTWQSGGLVCGGDYICKTGDCDATNGAGNSGFDVAVAKLAGLASAADDVKEDQSQIDIKAFTGKAMSCRKAFAGFSNCCKDAGWGQDSGLAACNSDEMAIGKAKAKKITVTIGERCDKKVLGACIQKSQVYCVFDGKLARIIQEQGRRDQLGVKFGSGDSPNCRGITVAELQSIDFDKINFADFYDDLMKNQKIPDTAAQVKLIKDRIAAQVNQQGGNK